MPTASAGGLGPLHSNKQQMRVALMTDIQDAAGNPLGAILAWGFTTQPPVTVILTVAKTETFEFLRKWYKFPFPYERESI